MSEQAQRQLAEALIDKVDRLEAENATLKQERNKLLIGNQALGITVNNLQAERDRLRQALNEAAEEIGAGSIHEHCPLMRAILFPSPSETEEGG